VKESNRATLEGAFELGFLCPFGKKYPELGIFRMFLEPIFIEILFYYDYPDFKM
jgi:hypothetical protein